MMKYSIVINSNSNNQLLTELLHTYQDAVAEKILPEYLSWFPVMKYDGESPYLKYIIEELYGIKTITKIKLIVNSLTYVEYTFEVFTEDDYVKLATLMS